MTIAERIRQLRKERKWSQEELSKKLKIGKTTISNWETEYSTPDKNSIISLSKIFGCSNDYLLGESDVPGGNFKTAEENEKYSTVIEKAKNKNISAEKINRLLDFIDSIEDK